MWGKTEEDVQREKDKKIQYARELGRLRIYTISYTSDRATTRAR
jgi:hypothetical protein